MQLPSLEAVRNTSGFLALAPRDANWFTHHIFTIGEGIRRIADWRAWRLLRQASCHVVRQALFNTRKRNRSRVRRRTVQRRVPHHAANVVFESCRAVVLVGGGDRVVSDHLQRGVNMRALLNKFMKDESGQGLVEYALIIALVAIGLIAILVLFRNSIGNVFNESKNRLNNAPSGSY